MPQISKGETFADSQQLTATRLNQLVDSAQILVGAITDQPSITANTLEATDTTIVSDGGVLKEATISDFLNSGLPLTSAVINAPANKDIVVTPYDSASVVGSNYVSGDGLTVVVTTLAAHGLIVNNVVLISSAGTGYNGTFKITAVTSLTFTYVMFTAATATASPTACTYVKKATEIVNGNIVSSGSLYVQGLAEVNGDISIAGNTTLTGEIKGTANFTGVLQVNGTPVYALYSKVNSTLPAVTLQTVESGYRFAAWTNTWINSGKVVYTETFVVPSEEIWEVTLVSSLYNNVANSNYGYGCNVISTINSVTTTTTIGDTFSIGVIRYSVTPYIYNVILTAGTHIVKIAACWFVGTAAAGSELNCSTTVAPSHKTISKFKTA